MQILLPFLGPMLVVLIGAGAWRGLPLRLLAPASLSAWLLAGWAGFGTSAMCLGALLLARRARQDFMVQHALARRDPVTGAGNRRAFYDRLQRIAAAGICSTQLLIFLDLDGFKAVNDRHGHAAGDEVLRHVAGELRREAAYEDSFARYGGDEFVLLLDQRGDTDPYSQAQALHERVARSLSRLHPGLGCSMGAIVFDPASAPAGEDLVGWADLLMYEVKRADRGALRIALAPSQSQAEAA